VIARYVIKNRANCIIVMWANSTWQGNKDTLNRIKINTIYINI